MKRMKIIILTAMMVLLASAMAVNAQVQVRGPVANIGAGAVTWDYKNFAGFYYDIDKNVGTESITLTMSDVDAGTTVATLSDQPDANNNRGVVYSTQAQPVDFKFKAWGQYDVIGFLADKYFAAYMQGANGTSYYLYDQSKNRNLMTNNQLSKVLIDDDTEQTVTSETPLALQEGYQLAIKSIDVKGNKVYLELDKNGQAVDSKVVQPSIDNAGMSDQTYYYKIPIGQTADIIQIAVHFKNAFGGVDTSIATVDGIFQVSDTPTNVNSDQQYDKMSIRNVDPTAMKITMDNKDNQITLSRNQDTVLMQNIHIKTADQAAAAGNPLRFYIYKLITAPGTYEIRGPVTDLGVAEISWDPQTFAGFYYDIDKNIGTETLTFRPSAVNSATATLSDQADANNNRGVVYQTTAQQKLFKYAPWGSYQKIGFLASPYFAAYNTGDATGDYLYDTSKNRNLMTNEQLTKILMDDNKEITLTTTNPLVLGEGYQLAIKSIDTDGNKVYVELSKNGQPVDDKVVQPSIANAGMSDQTYYYKTSIGETSDIIQIALHFKNAFRGTSENIASVDGEFQISDTPDSVKTDAQYDKMSIRTTDPTAGTIMMDNKDNAITLSKNKDTVLMQNIHIKTADQDVIDANNPLRYYIYTAATIANQTAPAPAPAPVPAAPPVEVAPTNNTTTPVVEQPVAPVTTTNVTANATASTPAPAPAPAKSQPGFEGIVAITGLFAVAYLVLGRKQ